MRHFYDFSKNWATVPEKVLEAENMSEIAKRFGGNFFVPDIRNHTANVAHIFCKDWVISSIDGFEPIDQSVSNVYSKGSTDGIIVWWVNALKKPITVGIKVADCGALTFSYRQEIMGILHAGWKGVSQGIIQNTVQKLQETLGQDITKLKFQISPMATHGYEFSIEDFDKNFSLYCEKNNIPRELAYSKISESKIELHLHEIIIASLKNLGIQNITPSPENTLTEETIWPSHRLSQKTPKKQGRFLSGITSHDE